MTPSGIPLKAKLIVDNCVIVTLHEYYCEDQKHLAPRDLPSMVSREVGGKLDLMKQYAPDQLLHTTDRVANEFRPGAGRLGQIVGVGDADLKAVQRVVGGRLHIQPANGEHLQAIRAVPKAPGALGLNLRLLSDEDLSLAALAFSLSSGTLTYVLTHDHDLLYFISWFRTRPEAHNFGENPSNVRGVPGLLYIEAIHRSCGITTDEMEHIITFCYRQELKRKRLDGTSKGESIERTLDEVWESLSQSRRIKERQKGML